MGNVKTKSDEVLRLLDEVGFLGRDDVSGKVEDAFEKLFASHGIDGVGVKAERDGTDWIVEFKDSDGDSEVVVFGVDSDEGAFAIVMGEQGDTTSESGMVVDLDPLDPPVLGEGGLDLTNLKWMNRSVLSAILAPGDIGNDKQKGNEAYKTVVRGGSKVKVPIRVIKNRMSSKQKAALVKARRKANTGDAKRKRALSMKMRKKMGLK